MKKLLIVLSIFIAGCATQYDASQAEERSKLRVIAPHFGGAAGLRAVYYKNNSCDTPEIFGIISLIKTTKSDHNIKMPPPSLESAEYFDKFIEPGKTMMTIGGSSMNIRCTLPVTMDIKKDTSYQLKYYWTEEQCHIELSEIIQTGNQVQYVTVPLPEPKEVCSSGFNSMAL